MRDVQLDLYSTGQTARVFDANGDGLVGYKILGVSRDFTSGGDLIYKDVSLFFVFFNPLLTVRFNLFILIRECCGKKRTLAGVCGIKRTRVFFWGGGGVGS